MLVVAVKFTIYILLFGDLMWRKENKPYNTDWRVDILRSKLSPD
jgi:hypothetical protein